MPQGGIRHGFAPPPRRKLELHGGPHVVEPSQQHALTAAKVINQDEPLDWDVDQLSDQSTDRPSSADGGGISTRQTSAASAASSLAEEDAPHAAATAIAQAGPAAPDALHQAARSNDAEAARFLLEHCGDAGLLNQLDLSGESTPLDVAVRGGAYEVAEILLDYGAEVDQGQDSSDGVAPLHIAAATEKQRALEIATLLLKRGALVNRQTSDGHAPLHFAAAAGTPAVAQLLLDHRADVNVRSTGDSTPLHCAVRRVGGPERVGDSALLPTGSELTRILLAHGAEAGTPDHQGVAPIHYAAGLGTAETCRVLLDHDGTMVTMQDTDGYTPLHYAAGEDNYAVALALLDRGAEVAARAPDGRTPLDCAVAEHGEDSQTAQALRPRRVG